MQRRVVFCALTFGLLVTGPVVAADERTGLSAEIDRVFAAIGQNEPGCAAGVIHAGQYIHKAGYGLANLEHGIPITAESIFRTGSVGKQFTAMAIAILAERGDLDLDADVHEYLPDLVDYGHTVTIRQMVHHIAGMGDYDHDAFRNPDGSEFRFGNQDFWTIEEFYQRVSKAGLRHEPGIKYEYSNLAYFLLGQVVERVSGETLRQFADREIFRKLGMYNTRFNDNVNQPIPQRADGYARMDDGSWEIFMTNLSWVGDGGVYTSLDDFLKWDQNFYNNRLGKGGAGLLELVTTPHPDTIEYTDEGARNVNYAFGMRVDEKDSDTVIYHSGGWVSFSAMYMRYPERQLSIVTFCNSTEQDAPELAAEMSEIALAAISR